MIQVLSYQESNLSYKKKQTDGSFKDYILSTGEVEQSTDLSGELTFKKLDTGTYKIIETTQLSEYGSPKYSINGISDIDTFTIKSNDYKGISISVVNPKNEVTKVSGTKTWDDKDNQDGKRPSSVKVNLLANGVVQQSKIITASDSWDYEFANLEKYKDGKTIVYTITEDAVPDYTTSVDGYNLKNSLHQVKRA